MARALEDCFENSQASEGTGSGGRRRGDAEAPMIGNRLRLANLPDASAYHSRVALTELSRREILQAVAEYDRLGQDRFLEKYGFGMARSYRLVVDGETYDSKAIVGAAYGFLPGREPLAAADFSGGAATVGRLLSSLGFRVTRAVSGLSVGKLVELLSALRLYRSPTGRQALYQPLALLWAVGRAHQGLARIAEWSETETALGEFLERHGEHPRPHYPVAALYHAGLWDLAGPRPVPPAHGNAPRRADHAHQADVLGYAASDGGGLGIRGLKLGMDGGAEGGCLCQPYASNPAFRGHAFWEPDDFEQVVEHAVGRDWRVGCHAVGDCAVRRVLDAYEQVVLRHPDLPPGTLVIEHAFLADGPAPTRYGWASGSPSSSR